MKYFLRDVLTACLVACVLSILVIGFANPVHAADSSTEIFKNDVAAPATDEEKALVTLLRDTFAQAYDKGDTQTVSGILAPDFQKRLMIDAAKMRVEDRTMFLKTVKNNGQVESKLTYAIQSLKIDGASGVVIALATYTTEHFNPRALETLVFKKEGDAWKLSQISQVLLHPNDPKHHKAEVVVTEKFWDSSMGKTFSDVYAKLRAEKGAEGAIQYLKANMKPRSGYSLYGIAIFREPPKIGSEIKFDVVFTNSGEEYPFEESMTVDALYTHFVYEVSANEDGDFITFTVSVDGEPVGEFAAY